jgi:hypothetical protein
MLWVMILCFKTFQSAANIFTIHARTCLCDQYVYSFQDIVLYTSRVGRIEYRLVGIILGLLGRYEDLDLLLNSLMFHY